MRGKGAASESNLHQERRKPRSSAGPTVALVAVTSARPDHCRSAIWSCRRLGRGRDFEG